MDTTKNTLVAVPAKTMLEENNNLLALLARRGIYPQPGCEPYSHADEKIAQQAKLNLASIGINYVSNSR